MSTYTSAYTGAEIDAGIAKADANETLLATHSSILTGTLANMRASEYSFVKLGAYNDWATANAALDSLMAVTGTDALKYEGRLRFTVSDCNYECKMFCRNSSTPVWVQMVSGAIAISSSALAHGTAYNVVSRYCSGGTISVWVDAFATAARAEEVYNTAIGVGSETALASLMKAEKYSSSALLNDRVNHLLYDTGSGYNAETNGLYLLRYGSTGASGVLAVLLQTGFMSFYGTQSSYRRQLLVGGFRTDTNPDSSAEGTVWSNYGFTDNIVWNTDGLTMKWRNIAFAADGTVSTAPTAWTTIF